MLKLNYNKVKCLLSGCPSQIIYYQTNCKRSRYVTTYFNRKINAQDLVLKLGGNTLIEQ